MAENRDIEQNIKLTYETNAENTSKDVNKLTDSVNKLDDSQEKVAKSTNETSNSQKKAAGSAKEQDTALKGLDSASGGVISSMKAMLKQMWLIVSNPLVLTIVAIVGSLALLFKAFTSTKDGGEKMDRVMAGISATIDVLRDRVLKVGSAITKFFRGDFKGAIEDGKAAVAGFGDEVSKEFTKASNATKELQAVEDAMRSLGETRAKLNRDLSAAKEIITDENASYAEKKKAIDAVKEAEGRQTEQEIANARRKLKAIQELNALSDTSSEDLKKESDAKIALYNLEQESANNRRAINKAEERAANDEKARLKAISDERKLRAKEQQDRDKAAAQVKKDLLKLGLEEEEKSKRALQDLQDKTDEQKLARQKERDLAEIEALKQKGIDVENILKLNTEKYNLLEDELKQKREEEKKEKENEYWAKEAEDAIARDEEQKKRDEAVFAHKQEINDKLNDLQQQGFATAKMLFAKNKGIQKGILIAENAVGLASVAINTATGISKAMKKGAAGIPEAVMVGASGALSAVNIIAATAKGLKALGGGSAGGGGGGGQAVPSGGAVPQVDFQTSSENQIGNTLATNVNEAAPVQAFVVSSEVTTAQALDRNRIESNSF